VALIDDIRTSIGLSDTSRDFEVRALIDAAIEDMRRVGVLDPNSTEADIVGLYAVAVISYCKANFGFDNPDMVKFNDSYRRITCDLINSKREDND